MDATKLNVELAKVQSDIESKRAAMGAVIVDKGFSAAEQLQAEIADLETRAAQLRAGEVELNRRHAEAEAKAAAAKKAANLKRFAELNAATEKGAKANFAALVEVMRNFEKLADAQRELTDLQRTYPGETSISEYASMPGFANLAGAMTGEIQAFEEMARRLK